MPLSKINQGILVFLSFAIVAFGQPAWNVSFCLFASLFGYAIFWRVLLCYSERKHRFWIATCWFTSIQLVQLSWSLSHPFWYIYFVYFGFSLAVGMQFGFLALFFRLEKITHISRILFIAATWTLMEWMRLYVLSGYSWNPVGLALAGNLLSLQTASLMGVYGLSFLVIVTNLFALRVWVYQTNAENQALSGIKRFAPKSLALWLVAGSLPYLFGAVHLHYHNGQMAQQEGEFFSSLLVQTAFPVEDQASLQSSEAFVDSAFGKWEQMLTITQQHKKKAIQLILFPECVVPFSAYTFIFPYEQVKRAFHDIYGPESLQYLPALQLPLAYPQESGEGKRWMVNHAFWVQAIANVFDAGIVVGLEDVADHDERREYYSSAIYIEPDFRRESPEFSFFRYSKRILVPMGEYIPFSFCQDICARYGVFGSFTCGQQAQVWQCDKVPFGISICYEETFGNLMRENKQQGAEMLVNLTSDAWFPNSRLMRQHLEHSRLRTVENGIPLLRACNTGITCAIDSLGRDIARLGEDDKESEWVSDSLHVNVPLYTYQTLYSHFGDGLVVGFSLLTFLLFLRRR